MSFDTGFGARPQMAPDPLLHLGGIGLHPAEQGAVFDRDAPVGQHGREVAVADREGQIPRVLAWRLSITMEAAFCVEALEEALARHGKPDVFNMDQGSQFTGQEFTGVLLRAGVAISMDGKGAWRDNVFVERLWRSVTYTYEKIYLRAYDTADRGPGLDRPISGLLQRPKTTFEP